jgi:hypothetical protein
MATRAALSVQEGDVHALASLPLLLKKLMTAELKV